MTILRALMLGLAAPVALASPTFAMAQDQEVVVRAEAARAEIERILNADNVDTARLSPRGVADAIAAIERGRAPADFWNAYRLHVQAWAELADAVDNARPGQGESAFPADQERIDRAQAAIESSFAAVQRIARQYGARLPTPPGDTRKIT